MADLGFSRGLARVRDRIDTGPRSTDADAIRLNRMFRGADTTAVLPAAEGS